MKLFILLFIVTYYTFRCNAFVVKKHLLDSEAFLFNPTRRMDKGGGEGQYETNMHGYPTWLAPN